MVGPRICACCFRVLTVCTGNTHRPALAEELLVRHLGGVATIRLDRATTQTVAHSARTGAASAGSRTGAIQGERCQLTAALVRAADLVLGTEATHREAAVRLAPAWAAPRTFTVGEFALLIDPVDADAHDEPARRLAALVSGAASRRPSARPADGHEVTEPPGQPTGCAHARRSQIESAVERIAAAVFGLPTAPTADRPGRSRPASGNPAS